MASFFVFVIGALAGAYGQYKLKLVERAGARIEKLLTRLGP